VSDKAYLYANDGGILLGNVAEVLDLGLQTPVPLVFHQERMLVEMSAESMRLAR